MKHEFAIRLLEVKLNEAIKSRSECEKNISDFIKKFGADNYESCGRHLSIRFDSFSRMAKDIQAAIDILTLAK